MRQLASVVTVDKVWNLEGKEKGLRTIHALAGVEYGK